MATMSLTKAKKTLPDGEPLTERQKELLGGVYKALWLVANNGTPPGLRRDRSAVEESYDEAVKKAVSMVRSYRHEKAKFSTLVIRYGTARVREYWMEKLGKKQPQSLDFTSVRGTLNWNASWNEGEKAVGHNVLTDKRAVDPAAAVVELPPQLMEAIRSLTPAQAHSVQVRYFSTLRTRKEWAAAQGCDEKADYMRHRLALERMRNYLERAGVTG